MMARAKHLRMVLLTVAAACARSETLTVAPEGGLRLHYLPDFEYVVDSAAGYATSNHLVIFNPGKRDANVTVRVLFEDRNPASFPLQVAAMSSRESNQSKWPVPPNTRFGLIVESDEAVVVQATIGWTNTLNDYSDTARTIDGSRARETALSYLAHRQLATRWVSADGIVLQLPRLFIRESEWAVILNPQSDTAHVTLTAGLGELRVVGSVDVPPSRIRVLAMDSLVPQNTHYGPLLSSDIPVTANWRRTVYWSEPTNLMAFWSLPMTGLDDASAAR